MSDSNKYPNSGALFINKRKVKETQPDLTGNVTIDREMLQVLITQAKEGKDIKMDVSGWKKKTKDGSSFISFKVAKPWEKSAGSFSRSSRSDDDDLPF